LAIGSGEGPCEEPDLTTVFPQTFEIDYVRFWKKEPLENDSDILSILPNPNNGNFNLQIKIDGLVAKNIFLFDVFGKLILEKSDVYKNELNFDLEFLVRGTYFLKVEYNHKIDIQKIIII
jgi:hypothetical protein